MDSKPKLKVSAIITDLTDYLKETADFEAKNTVKEKHVTSQIVQMPAPPRVNGGGKIIGLPGQQNEMITTVMISVMYVHEITETVKA